MKTCLKIVIVLLLPVFCYGQQNTADSLQKILLAATTDSGRYYAIYNLYSYYEETNRDSALHYAEEKLQIARENGLKLSEASSLIEKGYQLMSMGRYAMAHQILLEAFSITEDSKNKDEKSWMVNNYNFNSDKRLWMLSYTHHVFAILMWQTDNKEAEIFHFKEARRIAGEIGQKLRLLMADMNLGRSYLSINKLDSALDLERESEKLAIEIGFKKYLGQVYAITGDIYLEKGDKDKAQQYYYRAVAASTEQNNMNTLSASYFLLTNYYLANQQKDSALKYAMLNLTVIKTLGLTTGRTVNLGTIYENIYRSYKLINNHDSIFKYQGLTLVVKDSLAKLRIKNLTDFQTVSFKEQIRLQNLEKEKVLYQSKIRTYALFGGLAVFLLIALILYRNNRQKQTANKVLESTLNNLKSTQSQLVQSEKMASLGELTAGIAHEIQNPLNFVNNFSEVSSELLDEMDAELRKGDLEEAKAIANDVKHNLDKINHHGRRADAIVKGMLQHSRSSSGRKEPTNINALADEYLRLAYHGLRAKDKSFNATTKTDFDETIGDINIIPQDIGRVILNLITNAFYVVDEKKKLGIANYEPTVTVGTKKAGNKVLISVKDNGSGIPAKVLDKIFQPFFTTKPTGQGTGLGLSLSYDIVKAHGGELKVETRENEETEFIIQLPI